MTAIARCEHGLTQMFSSRLQIRYGAFWTPVRGDTGVNGNLTEVYLEAGEYVQKMKIYNGSVVDLWIPLSQKG